MLPGAFAAPVCTAAHASVRLLGCESAVSKATAAVPVLPQGPSLLMRPAEPPTCCCLSDDWL